MKRSSPNPALRALTFSIALATFLFGSQYCFASLLLGTAGLPLMPCHDGPSAPPCHASSKPSPAPPSDASGAPCCIQLTTATESALASTASGVSFILPSGTTTADPALHSPARFTAFLGESPPGPVPGPHRGRSPPLS